MKARYLLGMRSWKLRLRTFGLPCVCVRSASGLVMAGLLVLGVGCGRRDADALRVVMNLSEEEWSVFRTQVFPAFEEQTGIPVRAFQIPSGQLASQLEALEQAGRSEIDVFAQDNMSLAALVNRGLVLDMSAYAERIPGEVTDALVEAGRFNGRLYFMPFRPNVQISYYNREAFDRHGLSIPMNWVEVLEVAKAFHAAEGVGRVVFKADGGNPTATQLYELILQAGGDPFVFDDAGCVAAFQFLQELGPYLSPESSRAKWDTVNEILARQEGYLAQNWPFGVGVLVRDYGLDFIATYGGWEGPAGRAHVVGGDVLAIPRQTAKKEAALAFIAYLQSQPVQELLVRELGWPSIREDAYTDVPAWQQVHFQAVQEALSFGVFRENVAWWPAYQQMIVRAFQAIMDGADVQDTLTRYKRELEREKERFR